MTSLEFENDSETSKVQSAIIQVTVNMIIWLKKLAEAESAKHRY